MAVVGWEEDDHLPAEGGGVLGGRYPCEGGEVVRCHDRGGGPLRQGKAAGMEKGGSIVVATGQSAAGGEGAGPDASRKGNHALASRSCAEGRVEWAAML